jgi:homoserine dehydrogenase
VVDDAMLVVNNPEVDIVVELIGGYGIAKELVLKAIENGKHVVTANKALLAVHGNEIFARAQEGRDGGLRSRRGRWHSHHQGAARRPVGQPHPMDGRHHQRHHQLHPVRDARQGCPSPTCWAKPSVWAMPKPTRPSTSKASTPAQAHHDGALAFGIPVQFDKRYLEGITKLDGRDIKYAEELGYRIKLLGITRRTMKASSCACTRR